MTKNYNSEYEGQLDFYESYLRLIDNTLSVEDVLVDNTDGILKGNILEFKLNISDLSSVLFQAIKYLSSMRIKGRSIPANIVLISLNDEIAYIYKSVEYLTEIEVVYVGGSSKNNSGFKSKPSFAKFDYGTSNADKRLLMEILRTEDYTKINIDENCIVGWATRFYKEYPTATKSDFIGDRTGKIKIIGEIRQPDVFKDYIHPYTKVSNVKFQYLMDRLNDELHKKNLGAFYTPPEYAWKSLELLRQAIARVPKGNDYIILDRCAGTGNLQKLLTDDELSHVIVSTVEYYEYKVLLEVLGDKVRYIVPLTEDANTYNKGLVRGADALDKGYVNEPVIKGYINDPKTTIILFENPPYAETTSIEHQKKKAGKKSSSWKNSYVVKEMKKESLGATANDLGNAFIWSAFKYYLRQPTDSYIVYSPVKYWKAQHLIDKKFIDGFAFNRKHFHTNINACIMVVLWSNEDDPVTDSIKLKAYDIEDGELQRYEDLDVSRVHTIYSQNYYDKRKFADDTHDGIITGLNGLEASEGIKVRIKPLYNDNMIGYMVVDSSGFDNPDLHSSLLIAGRYNGNGFFLRSDNYLEKLPMFAASRYITYNREWTERARIMKSADGSERYFRDLRNGRLTQYLLKTLLFTVLETQNHMRSFMGSDNRYYKNELCLDDTNGDTLAIRKLRNLRINNRERALIQQWRLILEAAKRTREYNGELTYGLYQIQEELNTFTVRVIRRKNVKVYNYPELNGHISTLKTLVKEYYNLEIVPKLFEYEFLK